MGLTLVTGVEIPELRGLWRMELPWRRWWQQVGHSHHNPIALVSILKLEAWWDCGFQNPERRKGAGGAHASKLASLGLRNSPGATCMASLLPEAPFSGLISVLLWHEGCALGVVWWWWQLSAFWDAVRKAGEKSPEGRVALRFSWCNFGFWAKRNLGHCLLSSLLEDERDSVEVHTPCWPGAALESGHGPDGFRFFWMFTFDGVSSACHPRIWGNLSLVGVYRGSHKIRIFLFLSCSPFRISSAFPKRKRGEILIIMSLTHTKW